MASGAPDYNLRVGKDRGFKTVTPVHAYNPTLAKGIPIKAEKEGSVWVILATKSGAKIVPLSVTKEGYLNVNQITKFGDRENVSKGDSISATTSIAETNITGLCDQLFYVKVINDGTDDCDIMLTRGQTIATAVWNNDKFTLKNGESIEVNCDNITTIRYKSAGTSTLRVFAMGYEGFSETFSGDAEDNSESAESQTWE